MDGSVMQEVSRKRNLEKRRETSRYAARDRRGKEADIFVDLREVVPIVNENTVTHVDRIALLRVAATLCRMRNHIGKALQAPLPSESSKGEICSEETIAECLDGFMMIIDMDGLILYVTESVSIYLGITQTDLVGRHLREFTNQKDYEAYMKMAQANKAKSNGSGNDSSLVTRTIVIRMKSVISPRGRNLNLKSAIYKPVWVCYRTVCYSGNNHVNLMHCSTNPAGTGNSVSNTMSGVTSKNGEYTTGTGMTRHTCDMKISFISENMNKIVRSNQRSLIGSSFYDLVHPGDVARVSDWIRDLLVKSHCRTSFYRILGAAKNVIWVQTDAITVNHTIRGKKEQYIICTHYFLGAQTDASSAQDVELNLTSGALPVVIKQEPDDAAEYLGRQPQFVDCVDFTPLISNEASLTGQIPTNLEEYGPVGASEGDFGRPSTQGQIARKNSYDDVLQWLFRDHPDSPAPFTNGFEQNMRSNQDDREADFDNMHRRPYIGDDPPLTVSAYYDPSRRESPEHSGRRGKDSSAPLYRHERSNNSDRSTSASAMGDRLCGSYRSSPLSSNGNGQNEGASPMEWSPLAAGIAECNLQSPSEGANRSSKSYMPSVNVAGMRTTNRAVPPISQSDGYNLVSGTNAYRNNVGTRYVVYSNVPSTPADDFSRRPAQCATSAETSTRPGMRRPFGQLEPQQLVPMRVEQSTKPASHNKPERVINFSQQTNDGSMHKSPSDYSQLYVDCQDNLQSLAPFVAHEEMLQLTNSLPADLQGLFGDDVSEDWMNSFGPINVSMDNQSMCPGNGLNIRSNFLEDQLY
ncbi:hypothetical protein QR680_005392 [Steinernema hermaphroditum]|uniref:PAS domain-containing protein n=1 Tax=Steinernema hermaphroditum TaxID=289476 RepID=A0AA39HRU7_9BILA|nr:hypothetical protein QR680_005392 [Steinernema hermaphroditum]